MKAQIGFKRLPKWLKTKYIYATRGLCQGCNKSESEVGKLEIHRLIRGNKGGLYTVCSIYSKENNVQILCKQCHKKRHQNENRNIRSK
jgi:hypothetical protein